MRSVHSLFFCCFVRRDPSGHGRCLDPKDDLCPLVFEADDDTPGKLSQPPTARGFVEILKGCPNLEGVFLNACFTANYAFQIVESVDDVAVIAWRQQVRVSPHTKREDEILFSKFN